MRQATRRPNRPMTRIEIENAAVAVGIPRRAIWRVKGDIVLQMVAIRVKNTI